MEESVPNFAFLETLRLIKKGAENRKGSRGHLLMLQTMS